eukprot:gene9862-18449_t
MCSLQRVLLEVGWKSTRLVAETHFLQSSLSLRGNRWKETRESLEAHFVQLAESGHFPTFTQPSFTSDFTRPLSHPNATRLNEAIANLRRDICHITASHHLDLAREAKATQVRSAMEEHYNPDIIRIANCNAKRQAASAPGNKERHTQHPRRGPGRQHQHSTF